MNIGDEINLASLGLSQPAGASRSSGTNEDTFMTLMMAQLKNQDPFEPMQGGEFLTQLAQFEMASGINAMQAGLETLAGSMLSNQVLESAALVGKTVFAETSTARLDAGATLEGAVDVVTGASNVRLSVRNEAGEIVRQIALPEAAGRQAFVWDGLDSTGTPAPAGNYQITATMEYNGAATAARVLLADEVSSVTLGGRGEPPMLNLAGGGQLSFSSVLEIR